MIGNIYNSHHKDLSYTSEDGTDAHMSSVSIYKKIQ